MPEKIYWFQTKSTGQNFEIYWSDLSDLSHVCIHSRINTVEVIYVHVSTCSKTVSALYSAHRDFLR